MDGTKKSLIVVGGVAVILLAVVANLTAQLMSKEKIHEAQVTATKMEAERDSIQGAVAARDSMRQIMEVKADGLTQEADDLRDKVATAERARADAQLGVRLLRTSDAAEQEFRTTFPEFSEAMRVTEVADDPVFPIKYIMVPTDFARTFIIDHRNAKSFEAQRDSLLILDSLNLEIITLKDSIVRLTDQNVNAFRFGYESALGEFRTCNADYISLLKQPRFRLDAPSLAVILGSAAVGVAIGTRF